MIYPSLFYLHSVFYDNDKNYYDICLQKRFSTFQGKGRNSDLRSFPFIRIPTHWRLFFSFSDCGCLSRMQSAFIFIQFYREYLFLIINFKEIFETINIFFPSLYETLLPFFNCIIKKYKRFFRFTRHLLRYRKIAQAKSPNVRKTESMTSIYLVEAALAQRQFLKLVDENPCLYVGPHVENAVRRYASVFQIQSRPINANQVIATSPYLPYP